MNLLLKKFIIGIVPVRFQLPLRFCYERLAGNLEPEMKLLDQFLGGKKRVIDVGANYGFYSYYLAKKDKFVEAFEPLPGCAVTISAYRSPRIRVHNVALSSTSGMLRLFTPIFNGEPYPACSTFTSVVGPHESCEVPVRTLDEYFFEDVCLVKIDVEGHELEVLRGAVQNLQRERPVILVEIEQRHLGGPIIDVFKYIQGCGYEGFFFLQGKMRPISEFSFSVHQMPFLADVNNPDYVNNFFFLPDQTKKSSSITPHGNEQSH